MRKESSFLTAFACVIMAGACVIILIRMAVMSLSSVVPIPESVLRVILRGVAVGGTYTAEKWPEKYPFESSPAEMLEKSVQSTERLVTNYCTISFPATGKMSRTFERLKKTILRYDLEGTKTYPETSKGMEECYKGVENIVSLADFCAEEDIPFLYVQTPSVDFIQREVYGKTTKSGDEIAEQREYLRKELRKEDVPFLDYTDVVPPEEYTFDGSGHWMPLPALKATAALAKRLEQDYGLTFDAGTFDPENYYNWLENYPTYSEEIAENDGAAYEMWAPREEGNYRLTQMWGDRKTWAGSFGHVFFNPPEEWYLESDRAYHNILRMRNSAFYNIENLGDCQNDVKILILSDSFDWIVNSYLTLGIREMDVIHNLGFDGSIRAYIRQNRPDIVIVSYLDSSFSNSDMLDFR